jgi:hypothetical protein
MENNVNLNTTTFSIPTANQLGYTSAFSVVTPTNLTTITSGTIYPYGYITIGKGVYILTYQMGFKCTTAGTITKIEWSVGTTSGAMDTVCIESTPGGSSLLNSYYTKTITRIITNTASTNWYGNFRVTHTLGNYQYASTSGTDTYLNMRYVRIG